MDMTTFRPVRRQDRLLDATSTEQLLKEGEYGFLALCSPDGYGYGVPISFVYAPQRQCIYFHCAPEGYKLDALRANDRVSFCVVGPTEVHPYTTAYESAHLFGRLAVVEDTEERWEALLALRAKYNPELADAPDTPIRKSWDRTTVLRLRIEHLSGKCKRISPTAR